MRIRSAVTSTKTYKLSDGYSESVSPGSYSNLVLAPRCEDILHPVHIFNAALILTLYCLIVSHLSPSTTYISSHSGYGPSATSSALSLDWWYGWRSGRWRGRRSPCVVGSVAVPGSFTLVRLVIPPMRVDWKGRRKMRL